MEKKGFFGRFEYKWIVLSVTTIGALMAAIDSTIVILGLPDMMVELHSDLVSMIWVIMGYILISTVFLLTFGRVADMLGRVRMYNLGFAVFTVGSALCGLSASANQLILFRLIQGSGAALMVVNSVAILTEVFSPDERGRALGINAVTFSAGGVIGPVLGGLILTAGSWRWIFFGSSNPNCRVLQSAFKLRLRSFCTENSKFENRSTKQILKSNVRNSKRFRILKIRISILFWISIFVLRIYCCFNVFAHINS